MCSTSFDDILHRADRLSLSVHNSKHKTNDQFNNISVRFDPSLDDVFRESETLWRKKRPLDDRNLELQANILLGEHGFSLGDMQTSSVVEIASRESVTSVSPQTSSSEVIHDSASLNTDKVKLDAERAFLNQCTVDLTVPNASSKRNIPGSLFIGDTSLDETDVAYRAASTSSYQMESAFAKSLSKYVIDGKRDDLAKGFMEAALTNGDFTIRSLWEHGVALLTLSVPIDGHQTLRALRSSMEWINCLVERSLNYLEKNFMLYMKEVVQWNMGIEAMDMSDTLIVVNTYLKVKYSRPIRRTCQDGIYGPNGHAVWEVIYHCFRVGDYKAAADIARSHLQKLSSCVALVAALFSVAKANSLSIEDRDKLKAEWRAEYDTIVDVYKKALYCAFLGGDVPEVCDSLESWLWLKLASCHFDTTVSLVAFVKLQRTITFEYGEDYFAGNDSEQTLFFEALLLSGQFERAIHALCKRDKLVHAVHLAILAYVNDLLMTSSSDVGKLLTTNEKDPLECSMNLSRLILMYVKSFELTDVGRAMDYYFVLRRFDTPIGSNMFYGCVSRLIYLNGESYKILGRIDENGIRHEGFIDKYGDQINVADTIAKVAADCELSGDAIKAVRLYHAAKRYEDAMRVMCDCLADALRQQQFMSEPRQLAIWLANIYERMAEKKFSRKWLATLCLLIDLSTFFHYFSINKYSICMDIVKKLKCIPLEQSEVAGFVSMFHMVPVQVRSLQPDLCLAIMHILVDQFNTSPCQKEQLRCIADTVVAFVARIPFKFSTEINMKLLELSSQIH